MSMESVTFRNVEGRNVPVHPWPQVFYVTKAMWQTCDFMELRPLTLCGLLKGVARNFVTMNWWRLHRLLWWCGLLTTREGELFDLRKQWTWRFWRELRGRRERSA